MQSFGSRPGSSDMRPKSSPSAPNSRRSLSPCLRKGSFVWSNSAASKPSKVSERKPSPKLQSFQEKKNLQEDLKRTKEERSSALQELEELKKKKNEESLHSQDRIKMLEQEAEKAKESEGKMLESLFSQTKQLEQTKILLEEAKLEMRNLPCLASIQATDEMRKLRNELRLALQAEEKSNKAMDDLAMALKEVTAEATQAKSELSATKSDLEKVSEQRLQNVLKEYNQLKQEFEDSTVAWKEKEDSFINCIKFSEEETNKKDQEISRLTDAHRMAREETSKLRDIIKQAINEATVIKESLEIARVQNHELEEQVSKKENALQQIKHDYESLKVSEAAALDSVRELKSLLASVSAAESNKTSNLSDFESFRLSKATTDDRKISKNARKFSSDRWTDMKPLVQQSGHRLSVGESDLFRGLGLEKERSGSVSNLHDIGLPSFLFSDDRGINTDDFDHLHGILFSDTENEKKKKKKTAFRRFGDVLMRRSVHKP